jgi:tetratricopeptide (TPR) repeat protein
MRRRGWVAACAGLAIATLAAHASAQDAAAWAACQGVSAPTSIDQLLNQCADAGGCEVQSPAVDLDRLIAGCTAVIGSPAEPPLRRALAAYQRGEAHALRGDPSHAIIDYDFALSLRPDFAEAIERRGAAFAKKGDDRRAVDDLSQAIAIKPGLARAWSERGQTYFRLHDTDRAIADLTQALALHPDNVVDLNNRCWIRAAADRDLPAALADCDRAVSLAPHVAGILDSRGFVHLRMRRYRDAVDDYVAALAAHPSQDAIKASSLYGAGLAQVGLGEAARGQSNIAAALALDPAVARDYAAAGLEP